MNIRKRLDVYKVLRKYNLRFREPMGAVAPVPAECLRNHFSVDKMRKKQRELATRIIDLCQANASRREF